jgi:putative oxidoreductase
MLDFFKNKDLGLLLARLAIGIPMLFYGVGKVINGIEPIKDMVAQSHLPGFLAYGVYVGEVLAPLMMIAGIYTRWAALIFAFNCLCALLIGQSSYLLKLNDYGGWAVELLVMYMLVGLSLFFTGGGKYSLSKK